MAEQVYYEDVTEESELPPLTKQPTTRQLVMWAGASGDYYAIHYDKDFAQSKGLPGVIVHGQLVASFLGQLLTDWIGKQGKLIKLACSYKGMNFPGETITCRGKVSKKYIEDGEHRVECHIWAENAKGEKTVIGKAIVALPARG
ncbi:MAG TPA: dehydratase [Dehalococcoidia bacterium]|nr:dehydratase [Dehalococcoidia bacterium]